VEDPKVYFGERVAASYGDLWGRTFQPEAVDPAVSLLAELAGSGHALELAIGTGRIGLPLSRRGVPVRGIAGLRLRDRWPGWNPGPFTTDSHSHVSIWQKPEL
jgi:hypothetical protein